MQHKNAVLQGLQDMRAYDGIGNGVVYVVNNEGYTTDQMIREIEKETEVGVEFCQQVYDSIISYMGKFTQSVR